MRRPLPSRGIGAHCACAAETVGSLLADAVDGTLPPGGRRAEGVPPPGPPQAPLSCGWRKTVRTVTGVRGGSAVPD
ncbi:hypothetical protein ACIQCD_17595 [Streptomyces sp. NPDC093250]|uniref:hypothetical protein n=1 Tax=Streptomyces sp. NPDC093250 TaxID=3366036 RepID=UPI0037F3B818